jgi:hypothetical protein
MSQLLYLRYGNYSHATAEASVVIDRIPNFNDGGQQTGYKETWNISGCLQAATQNLLHAEIAILKAAYSIQGQAIGLFFADGNATAHILSTAGTEGGCRVVRGPSFPQGEGAEAGLYRTYQISVEADVIDPSAQFISYSETLSFSGGGPRVAYQTYIYDVPEPFILAAATPYQATQQGQAVGRFAYPVPPGPLWPANLMENPQVQLTSPRRKGPVGSPFYTEYPVSWSYRFESASPLTGIPNRWVG